MSDPTIEQARTLRETLEREIYEAIQRFEQATGLGVRHVELEAVEAIGIARRTFNVSVEVDFTRCGYDSERRNVPPTDAPGILGPRGIV